MSIERASSGRLKLYFYLKDLPLEYKIDYQDVAYYLADKRSNYIYTKGVFYGYKLIECRYLGQDEKSKCLLFRYLASDDSDLKTISFSRLESSKRIMSGISMLSSIVRHSLLKTTLIRLQQNVIKIRSSFGSKKQICKLPNTNL